jgi:hypothetical protein
MHHPVAVRRRPAAPLVRAARALLPLLPLLLAVLLAALVASGCGGTEQQDKQDYTKSMRSAARDFEKASKASSSLPADATPQQKSAALDEQRRLMRGALERITKLDPPADAKKPHERLVKALGTYVELLDELAGVLGDPAKEGAVYAQINEQHVAVDIQEASKDLEDAGYDFGVK